MKKNKNTLTLESSNVQLKSSFVVRVILEMYFFYLITVSVLKRKILNEYEKLLGPHSSHVFPLHVDGWGGPEEPQHLCFPLLESCSG